MNVQDIVTRVRRTFGDEAAVQVTNDDIIRWINDGQIEIVKKNDAALETTDTMNIVNGQSQYSLPADLLILRSLRIKLPDMLSYKSIKYLSMQQFDETLDGWDGTNYTNSMPVYFTKYENNIILFPTPDQSATDGLKLLYSRQPVEVSSLVDTLSLPLIYHNTIVQYCMWQASMLDEDHEPGLMYKGFFQEDMSDLATRESADPIDYYPTVTVREYDQ